MRGGDARVLGPQSLPFLSRSPAVPTDTHLVNEEAAKDGGAVEGGGEAEARAERVRVGSVEGLLELGEEELEDVRDAELADLREQEQETGENERAPVQPPENSDE